MNKARITYRFDQNKEKFDRMSASGASDDPGTSHGHGPEGWDASERDRTDHIGDSPQNGAKQTLYDSQMLNQFTTDYGAWSSPFDMETERLERLIRESSLPEEVPLVEGRDKPPRKESQDRASRRQEQRDGRRRTADAHDADGSDEWGSADDARDGRVSRAVRGDRRSLAGADGGRHDHADDDWESGPIIDERLLALDSTSSYRTGGYSWFRVVASVVGAIATGVMLGLFIMQLFTNLTLNHEAPPVNDRQDLTDAPPVSLPGADHVQELDVDAQATAVSLPQNTVYMLQFGVFSSAEGAYAAIDQLQKAGIASAYEAGERHVVYAGFTPDRNSALLLSNQLAGMKLETYVKAYDRPEVGSLRWGEADAAHIEEYFGAGGKLAKTVSLLTLVHLEEKELTNFEDETIQALASSHQQWKMLAGELAKDVPEQAQEAFLQMNNSLTTAVESLLEYKKNPAVSYLWQAQSAAMNYVIQEKSLLRALAA